MIEYKADLHCHSTFSDGILTPFDLILLAKKIGLQGLSITDHDTISAYSEEVFQFAKENGIELIVGVEISSALENTGIHVLGYGVDFWQKSFLEFLASVQEKRLSRIKKMLANLRSYSIDIDLEKLYAFVKKNSPCTDFSIGRAHLARYLVENHYVDSMADAFDRYLKDGACCYVSGEKVATSEVIQRIKEAKGKAILAHPHLIKHRKIAKKLLDLPFDGIEGYYALIPQDQGKKWIERAKEKEWIVTGGSDFHGPSKAHAYLGASWTNEETVRRLCR